MHSFLLLASPAGDKQISLSWVTIKTQKWVPGGT